MEELRDLLLSLRMFWESGGTSYIMATTIRHRMETYVREMEEKIMELKSQPHQTRSITHEVARAKFQMNMVQRPLRHLRRRENKLYRE